MKLDMSNHWSTSFLSNCKPPTKLKMSVWAEKYRVIGQSTSPESGNWRNERTPYLVDIMDSVCDRKTEIIVCMMSSQVGKTELMLNSVGYFAHQEPSQMMMIQPNVEMAEAVNKERIDPMFRESPQLARLMDFGSTENSGNSRKSSNTIRMKHFNHGGYLVSVGANAPAGLASRPVRVVLADEIDRYPATTAEGNPLKLAYQRTTNFYNRKFIMVSTPTHAETSQIYEWWQKSDQSYYMVACPECGSYQHLKWEQVKWGRDQDGNGIASSAYYECEHCKFAIQDRHKSEMLRTGYWQATAQSKIRGYHLNSLYSPWVVLAKLVEEWLECFKLKTGMQEFLNLKMGLPFIENREEIDIDWVERRREHYDADLADGIVLLTAGIDVQDDRLAVHVIGWGEHKESWVVCYREIMGDPSQDNTWQLLDDFLAIEYSFANGNKLRIAQSCIDSGGHYTQDVYDYAKRNEINRIFAIKGRGGEGLPIVGNFTRNNRQRVALFPIGVDTAKELFFSRLRQEFEGAGYIHFPRNTQAGCDQEYYKMLLSERKELKFEKGSKKWIWKKTYKRNEALDTFIYAIAAYEILNPNIEAFKARLNSAIVSAPNNTNHSTPRRRIISRGVI